MKTRLRDSAAARHIGFNVGALFVIASLSGCAANADTPIEPADIASQDAAGEADEAVSSSADALATPGAARLARVTANGTGCPAGSWSANLSPDGQLVIVAFKKYAADVVANEFIDVKDCVLGITVDAPNDKQFSVASAAYTGYAKLDSAGMRATQSASYSFQGDRMNSADSEVQLSGPYDSYFLNRDEVTPSERVWSTCGVDRQLNITTRLVLRNNPAKTGKGAIDIKGALVLKLAWRRC